LKQYFFTNESVIMGRKEYICSVLFYISNGEMRMRPDYIKFINFLTFELKTQLNF